MTHRKIQYWVIPPEADAEFVANMEEVLDTYAKLYDPSCPVLCMDEQPVQLVREARPPIAATAKHPRRVDYEYERAVRRTSLCSRSRWRDGARPRPARQKPKSIGPGRWHASWRAVTASATR